VREGGGVEANIRTSFSKGRTCGISLLRIAEKIAFVEPENVLHSSYSNISILVPYFKEILC
jgi:hypothetical protein